MSHSRSPEIMTERPSLPGIHDLFGEHLARPIKGASPFALNVLSSSLPMTTSQTYDSARLNFSTRRRSDGERLSPQAYTEMKNTYGGDDDHRYLYTKNAPNGAIMLTSKYPSSQRNSMARDNYSPSSAASGEECCESRPERKKLPAKYECEYCGKYFNRPSSLKIHHNTHTGQKPFSCTFPGCGRSFSVMSNMRRHARTHGDSAVHLTREQSDSELQLTPAPSASGSSSRDSSRSATPLSYQRTRVANPTLPPRNRSGSISSDSSL